MELSEVILSHPFETCFWASSLGALVTGLLKGFLATLRQPEEF